MTQAKGFDVVHLGSTVTKARLAEALANANQFWLISGGAKMLGEEEIELIVDEWRAGMGMYVTRTITSVQVGHSRALPTVSDLFPCPLSLPVGTFLGTTSPTTSMPTAC